MTNLKQALLLQALSASFVVAAGAVLGGSQQAVSALLGALLMAINVGLLAWAVGRFFAKKSVALAGMVIVIKYLLLAAGLYWISMQPWTNLLWFALGILSTLTSAMLYGLTVKQ
jgi:hypothetical protein